MLFWVEPGDVAAAHFDRSYRGQGLGRLLDRRQVIFCWLCFFGQIRRVH